MLRNILRTSRWLTRRQINNLTPVILRHCSRISSKETRLTLDRQFSSHPPAPQVSEVDPAVFEEICNETLESLCDYFEEIVESAPNLKGADITYSVSIRILNFFKVPSISYCCFVEL